MVQVFRVKTSRGIALVASTLTQLVDDLNAGRLRTGGSRRPVPAAFLNVAADGPHRPGFDPAASKLLAHDRDVLGVGVETIGTDAGQAGRFDPSFPNHAIMHGAGKFGLASLCNLDQLPATGALVIAAPLKIVGGSGSPVRVLAIAPA